MSGEASRRWMAKRNERNAMSRNTATHFGEPWTEGELESVMRWDGHSEELLAEIAEELGRTIQACRHMYYGTPARAGSPVRFKITQRWVTDFCCKCGKFTDIRKDDRRCVDCD